jgi:pimeloyl-ACP methyl ester carboxylesterase
MWLSGFRSEMTSTKATAVADWARRTGTGFTRFDYSGHGQSEGRFEEACVGAWVNEALAVFDKLTRGPQILVGSSMGGWIALLMQRELRRRPGDGEQRLAGLVLIAPAWDMTERLIRRAMPPEARRQLRETGVWLRPSAYGDGPYPITQRLLEEGEEHLLQPRGRFRSNCPIRILHGERDADVPFEGSLDLMDLYGGCDIALQPVPDGEHRLARPEDIAALIGFIEELIVLSGSGE